MNGIALKATFRTSDVVSWKEMGYTACIEEGENMSAEGEPVVVRFRATNIFKKKTENGTPSYRHIPTIRICY